MKFRENSRFKRSITFMMIFVLSLTYIRIDAMAVEHQTNKQIIDIEDYNTQEFVDLDTAIENLPLPDTLRVVVKETVPSAEFSQQMPSTELLKQYHYFLQDEELSLEKRSDCLIYTYQDKNGQFKGYRVYGQFKSKSKDNEPRFWSCEADGTIIGRVEDVSTTWNCVEYNSSKEGTYKFNITNFENLIFETTTPSINIIVKDNKKTASVLQSHDLNETYDTDHADQLNEVTMTASPRAGTPTTITMNTSSRIVFTKTGAKRYNVNNDTLISNIDSSLNTSGYILKNATDTVLSYTTNYSLIKVEEDVTVTLTLDNLKLLSNGDLKTMTRELAKTLGANCLEVTGADVTIILKDNTKNVLTCSFGDGLFGGGAIVKNGSNNDNHKLIIQCEHADEEGHRCNETKCGRLEAIGTGIHTAAIGSSLNGGICRARGGFANLYIKGGNILANGGEHSPGIGAMCGTAHIRDLITISDDQLNNPQMLYGEICKNIQISGGRIDAKGNVGCAGIGSGWAGPVDGITISNGAYVKATGGLNSPGIGSGGANENTPFPKVAGIYNVSNILIKGGGTVVEAFGSNTENSPSHDSVPGIGCGVSAEGKSGKVTNVVATPEKSYLAVVRQGTSKESSTYINGGKPSSSSIAILPNKYYTLVYFGQISKSASVNGGEYKDFFWGEESYLKPGDTVVYKINCFSCIEDIDGLSTISDVIPKGMSFVNRKGTYTPGIDFSVDTGRISWNNQEISNTNYEFLFTVEVDEFTKYNNDFLNVAHCTTGGGLKFSSNEVLLYGKAADLTISKVDYSDVSKKIGNAGFTLYKCNETSTGHIHGSSCSWDSTNPYRTQQFTDFANGKLTFKNLSYKEAYILVETTIPSGYEAVTNNFVFFSIKYSASDIMGPIYYANCEVYGGFLPDLVSINSWSPALGTECVLQVKNLPKHTLSIKKEVKGDLGDKTKSFSFKVSLYDKSGIPIKNKSIPCTSASFISGVSSPYYSSLYFDSSGVASVTLKHGQSISLTTAIPYNGSYTVSEIAVSGYSTSTSNASGSNITNDMTASFINTKNGIVPTGLDESDDIQMVLLELSMIVLMGYIFLLGWRKRYQS